MTRQEYMNKLEIALEVYDDDLKQEIISDFDEHFIYGLKSGHTEEEIITSLGTIEEVIKNIDEPIKHQEEHKTQSLIKSSALKKVLINTESVGVDIIIEKSMDDDVHYSFAQSNSYFNSNHNEVNISKTIEGNDTLVINIEREYQNNKYFNFFLDGSLNIQIPDNIALLKINSTQGDIYFSDTYVQQIDITTISGDIDLHEIKAESININTTNGDINVLDCNGNLNCKTINGDLSIDDFQGGQIYFNTTNGDIHANMTASQIMAKTVSGDAELELKGKLTKLFVETTSGDIEIALDNDLTFNGVIESYRGDIEVNVNYPYMVKRNSYQFSSGDCALNIKTLNGDIEVNKNDFSEQDDRDNKQEINENEDIDGLIFDLKELKNLKSLSVLKDLKGLRELKNIKSVMDDIKKDLKKK